MANYMKAATLSDLPEGTAKSLQIGGATIALYNLGGKIFATGDTCPHRGGPLGEGELKGQVITCPWHAFQYDVATGRCLTNPALQISCHPVRVEGQDILVEI